MRPSWTFPLADHPCVCHASVPLTDHPCVRPAGRSSMRPSCVRSAGRPSMRPSRWRTMHASVMRPSCWPIVHASVIVRPAGQPSVHPSCVRPTGRPSMRPSRWPTIRASVALADHPCVRLAVGRLTDRWPVARGCDGVNQITLNQQETQGNDSSWSANANVMSELNGENGCVRQITCSWRCWEIYIYIY